jgi:hypothetical protein
MSGIGRGAYLDLRNRIIPVVDEIVENSRDEEVFIRFNELKKRAGINPHSLYYFFRRCKGVEIYRDFVVIPKSSWSEVKLDSLYVADPSEAFFRPFI